MTGTKCPISEYDTVSKPKESLSMNCLWVILLLFGCCGNRSGNCNSCACNNNDWNRDDDRRRDRERDRDRDRDREKSCDCDNNDSDNDVYDCDDYVSRNRYPNISRSETCGCEQNEQ